MSSVHLTSSLLAPISYYAKLYHYDKAIIEAHDNYLKQTYRNRFFIAGANGKMPLSIPVEKPSGKCAMRDVRISEHGEWRHQLWYALFSSYNSSPFFEYYEDDFRPFFEKKFDYLFDFNEEIREIICELIGFTPNVEYSTEYLMTEEINGDDFRELIHPKKDYKIVDPNFIDKPYYQVFAQKFGFTPNLSIIDLLFNMGPESLLVLRDSMK